MNRSTTFLLGLLLILGVIVFFLLPREGERESSYKQGEIHFSIDSSTVVKIEIQRQGKPVVLENVGGKWTITAPLLYPADQNAVQQLLSGLSKFKAGSLISSNPEKQRLFQVDSSGTKVSTTDRAGKMSGFIIGKMGPSFSEVYFRLPDSKDVYLGQGIDSWTFNKEVKDWRDKSVLSTPSEVMSGLTYTVGSKQYTFHKDSTGWRSGEKALDAATMNPALNTLANFKADDFVDTAIQIASKPMNLHISGADDIALSFYPTLPDSARYYVRKGNSNQLFVISKWTAQQLFKPIELSGTASRIAAITPPKEMPPPPPVSETPIQTTPKKETSHAVTPPVVTKKEETPKQVAPPVLKPVTKQEEPKKELPNTVSQKQERPKPTPPITEQQKTKQPETKPSETGQPAVTTEQEQSKTKAATNLEEEGDLTVYTVKKGETMTMIAKKFNLTVEQILKWNLLKSIAVKPGQELYIYEKK